MTEDTKSCYNTTIDNYYLDGTLLKRCHSKCLTCTSAPINEDNMNYIICQPNFYLDEETKSCYDSVNNSNYLEDGILKDCHSKCLTCLSGPINDSYMNCETWISNYYLIEDTKSCYNKVIDNYYLDNNILRKCHPDCLKYYNNLNINCTICQPNYYLTEDTKSCYNEIIDNYYLDNTILKKCHPNCLRCISAPINDSYMNCETCRTNYHLMEDTKSCYNEILHNYNRDENKEENNILKKCNSSCLEISIESQIKVLISNFNSSDIDNGNDIQIKEKDILITITNTENQKNNKNKNESTINLGECENKLKTVYNIPNKSSLYIIKYDINQFGMKIPNI